MPRSLAPILAIVAVAAGSGALWVAATSAEFRVTPIDPEPRLRLLKKVRLADADYFRAQEWSKSSTDALPDTMFLQFAVPTSFPFETRKDGQPVIRARLRHPDGRLFPLDIVTLNASENGERRLDISIPRMWPKETRSMVLEIGSPSGAVAESWTLSGLADSKQGTTDRAASPKVSFSLPLGQSGTGEAEFILRAVSIPASDAWSRPNLAFEAVLTGPKAAAYTIRSVLAYSAQQHDRLEVKPVGDSVQRIAVMGPIGFASGTEIMQGSVAVGRTDGRANHTTEFSVRVTHLDRPLSRPAPPGTMTYIPGWDGKDVAAPVTFHFGGKR